MTSRAENMRRERSSRFLRGDSNHSRYPFRDEVSAKVEAMKRIIDRNKKNKVVLDDPEFSVRRAMRLSASVRKRPVTLYEGEKR